MDWEKVGPILATAVDAIGGVIRDLHHSGSDEARRQRAADAVTAIGAIVETVNSGDVEQLDPIEAQADLQRLTAALGGNDEAADAALEEQFDVTDNDR